MRAKTRKKIATWLSYLCLLLASFIALFPVYWTITTSIKQRDDTFVFPPKFISFTPTMKNYDAIFATRGFWPGSLITSQSLTPSMPSLSRSLTAPWPLPNGLHVARTMRGMSARELRHVDCIAS